MSDKVKISAKRIPEHAQSSSVIRLITWVEDPDTKSRSIFDILELGQSTNENRTRKELLQEIDLLLEDKSVVALNLEILSR